MTTSISLSDRGLLLGDGLFETLLAVDGALQRPRAHLDRMAASCAVLGLPSPDRQAALVMMGAALARAGLTSGRAAVRLTLTAGSGGRGLARPDGPELQMFATAAAAHRPEAAARLALASVRRNPSSVTSGHKTLSYLDNVMARREALAAGADEAVMLNTEGQLACAAAANLFWISAQRLLTPDLSCGVLPGTERARVLAVAAAAGLEVETVRAGPEVLAGADGIFLTNSLNGLWPAQHWQGRDVAWTPAAFQIFTRLGGT